MCKLGLTFINKKFQTSLIIIGEAEYKIQIERDLQSYPRKKEKSIRIIDSNGILLSLSETGKYFTLDAFFDYKMVMPDLNEIFSDSTLSIYQNDNLVLVADIVKTSDEELTNTGIYFKVVNEQFFEDLV